MEKSLMQLNIKLSSDVVNCYSAGIDGYTAIVKKKCLNINDLEHLRKVLNEETYSINNIRLLGNGKIEIQGNIEDGIAVVEDISTIVDGAKTARDMLNTMLEKCGFYDSDIKLVISKLD